MRDRETARRSDGEKEPVEAISPSLHRSISPSPVEGGRAAAFLPYSDLPGPGGGAEAEANSDSLDAANLLPAELLDGGEVVILAVKPSLWFVAFRSFRWVAAMVFVIIVSHWPEKGVLPVSDTIIAQAAIALAGARVGLALLEWVSRLYVLTNRRVMRLKGIFNIDLFECQLAKIQSTYLTLTWYERLTGVGTISFTTAGAGGVEASWKNVNNPLELHERVRAAIHRAQRPSSGI